MDVYVIMINSNSSSIIYTCSIHHDIFRLWLGAAALLLSSINMRQGNSAFPLTSFHSAEAFLLKQCFKKIIKHNIAQAAFS